MIQFPDPNLADDDGLIAQGGDLSPEFLVSAYSQGVFPWFSEEQPILWWSPNPRMVLKPDDFKVSKSLRGTMRKRIFELRVDCDFFGVIRNCALAKRNGQDGTWITSEMVDAYCELYRQGLAHSFESYNTQGKLVGGLYGVSLGKCFFGESMFHYESNASKVAFFHLVEFAKQKEFHFIDAQQSTPHLKSLGAKDMQRSVFLEKLKKVLEFKTIKGKWTDLYQETSNF